MAKKAQTQTGPKALRAYFADASRAIEDEKLPPDPDPNLPRKDADGNMIKPGQWEGAPHDKMPDDSPVKVIGRDPDGVVYCISTTGHLRKMERWDMPALADLFAPALNTMMFYWPAFSKPKKISEDEILPPRVVRVERDKAMMAIINAAAKLPDFNPDMQHRGTGGWQDGQGAFVWHSGGWLWQSANGKLQRSRPAMHDGFLYTKQTTTIEPWQSPVTPEESPARRILEHLRTWNWQRPYIDPLLVLGWLGTAMMGGALKARPILFTTGGAGVGKSTLLELLNNALAGVATTTVNTTAAGIYQRTKRDSRPFLVDELESKAGSTRSESVIELARVAYTGGDISRGGADHEATTFTARNSFGFFAINPPPMGSQDKSRMAIVNLSRLDKPNGIGSAPTMSPDTDGRMMLRQIMDGWADYQGRILRNYWEALAPHGLDSRAIDTFGTLLAAAELLVGQAAMEEVGLPVTEFQRLGEIVAAATAVERTETMDNWHKCLDHLLQSTIDQWREGIKPTIGSVCDDVMRNSMDVIHARDRLQLVGLGMIDRNKVSPAPCLAVPFDGPALQRIYADTEFHKGVWGSALKQAPIDIVIRDKGNAQVVKINGSAKRCLLVDLAAFDSYASKL